MTRKQNIAAHVLSAMTNEWQRYAQIKSRIPAEAKISTGGISQCIWQNFDNIQDKIEWKSEPYFIKNNPMLPEVKMYFRLKQLSDINEMV